MTTLKRAILITGAGGGIGRGLSVAFAAQGHSIIATDLNLDAARATAAAVGQADAFALDVSS